MDFGQIATVTERPESKPGDAAGDRNVGQAGATLECPEADAGDVCADGETGQICV